MTEENRNSIKKIAKLRAVLEKRIKDMEIELDQLKTMLSLIDSKLLKESFKRPQINKNDQKTQASPKLKPKKMGVHLKTITGDLLAEIFTEKDLTKIVLAKDKAFEITTPPFTSFFIERVLAKMKEKDKEATKTGNLDPEKTITFNVKQEGNLVREIEIWNLRPDRIRELKSSLRWTLEKMYEKMKQQS
jgi:hypothetical protein